MLALRSRVLAVAAALALGVLTPGLAQAAPPANDDFDSSAQITTLPFAAKVDLAAATEAPDDPHDCTGAGTIGHTVWYHHTATEDGLLRFGTTNDRSSPHISAFTGVRGNLRMVENGCNWGAPGPSPVTIKVTAGQTYHFMLSKYWAGSAEDVTLQKVQLLPNDDFANAQPVTSLPFSTPFPDFALATHEEGEPSASECHGTYKRSVWYSYTPTRSQSVVARVGGGGVNGPSLAVYEGASLPELRMLGCTEGKSGDSAKTVGLVAGKTYYVQVEGRDYYALPDTVSLEEAPQLTTDVVTYATGERSIFEDIPFSVYHYGNLNEQVTTVWDFGDGTTSPPSTETTSKHRYAKDGNYTVTVRATSADGRTASDSVAVVVKTHDLGITKFSVPSSAKAGQQKEITVKVGNTRYLEKNAKVLLYRAKGADWALVGSLERDVPAHPTDTVTFRFTYTFTNDDAALGKAMFRADVWVPSPARDAQPLDNTVIAVATTVHPATAAVDQ
jgi:hypothetical protein